MSDGSPSSGPWTRREVGGLAIWLSLAAALRFWALGDWSLWGDEAHTLSDTLKLGNGEFRSSFKAYPLLYLVEWLALETLTPAWSVEWALRIVPAFAGTLAVGAVYVCARPLTGLRERHVLAALVTCSPWFLYHAQFARFYALLLPLVACGSYLYLGALRSGRASTMLTAVICLFLAGFVHPTAWILFVGLLAASLVGGRMGRPAASRLIRYPLAVTALFLVVLGVLAEDYVRTILWKLLEENPGADSVPDLVMGVAYNLGLAVSAAAGLGLIALWRDDRRLSLEVAIAAGLPSVVIVALAAKGTSVEQRYLIPVVPLMLLPAAHILGGLSRALKGIVPAPALVVPGFALLGFVPSLVSHYVDGNRHDLRGAAAYIRSEMQDGDVVISENHYLMQHYLPEVSGERLLEAPPQYGDLEGIPKLRVLEEELATRDRRLVWVVVPTYYLDLGGDETEFFQWAAEQGRLRQRLGRGRFDYHQNELQVYSVDLTTADRWVPIEEPEAPEVPDGSE